MEELVRTLRHADAVVTCTIYARELAGDGAGDLTDREGEDG